MNISFSHADRVKRIVRNLKKEEKRMLHGLFRVNNISIPLVWDDFFDLNDKYRGKAKYHLGHLVRMCNDEFEKITEEYFQAVIDKFFNKGTLKTYNYPILNITDDFDIEVAKKRFRDLVKIAHPDAGGSNEDFISLRREYEKFLRNKK